MPTSEATSWPKSPLALALLVSPLVTISSVAERQTRVMSIQAFDKCRASRFGASEVRLNGSVTESVPKIHGVLILQQWSVLDLLRDFLGFLGLRPRACQAG